MSQNRKPAAPPAKLPSDTRHHLGGMIFLVSLLVFFLASILIYVIYAYWRRNDPQSEAVLPASFLVSTACLIVVSGLVHMATRTVRREKRPATCGLLCVAAITAMVFMAVQFTAMNQMLRGPGLQEGTGKGVVGMVAVLAILHALHVAGGVIALGMVSVRSLVGRYDHERHWPVDFAAQYWHFLDAVWLCMLAAFWLTTGGFGF
ncbi:MAG: cytochrome c oxidase subunit 3 [Pirellulales bacterium]|nr:cytochrome c oxidase subunit 3 [Pirellulales bacterium]